jgi:hypothetical protein
MTVRPSFAVLCDKLRHSRDLRELKIVLAIMDAHKPAEVELFRDAVLTPKARGESPDETIDALARKALVRKAHARANQRKIGVNAAVLKTVREEMCESLFARVLKRAYHLNSTAKQKRKTTKRPPLKG